MTETEFGTSHNYTFPDNLSLTYFNHLSMYMLTTTCDFHISVNSAGMSVDYKTAMGTITVNGQQKAQEVRCKQGDHLELKILPQMLKGTQREILEVRKNEVTLVSTRLMDKSVKVKCTHRPSSKMLVFTHKLMAMENPPKNQALKGQKGQPISQQDGDGNIFKCCGPFPTGIHIDQGGQTQLHDSFPQKY
ncbi:uncharacterized protein LOC132546958 [Ylistrum balloti]|uniref:uncharacterized protein LOC132546958 n=1 Tax=Ylistrum balloti TaxID=509963 RepID=UPI0029058385|nr:uncharacterized protein LOC132546958 [Ylistrum balloti]